MSKFGINRLLFFVGTLAACETIPMSESSTNDLKPTADGSHADLPRAEISDLVSNHPLGRLDWGTNPKTDRPWLVGDLRGFLDGSSDSELATSLKSVIQEARTSLTLAFQPVAKVEMEGLLDSDPRMKASAAAISDLAHLPALALCSRIGPTEIAASCRAKTFAAIKSWIRTNVPSGNPINDSKLVPMIQAIDLVKDTLSMSDQKLAMTWVRQVIEKGDAYYASRPPLPEGQPTGNYLSWRLGVRSMSAVVVGDTALVRDTTERWDKHLAVNILDDGRSYDFVARDAMHYHLYNLQPIVLTALFAPAALSDTSKARLKKAVEFLKPFYTRERKHIEFQNSKSPFDKTRRDAGQGDYAVTTWDPSKANTCLFRSRIIFPEIRPWTADAPNGIRSPMEKAIYLLKVRA